MGTVIVKQRRTPNPLSTDPIFSPPLSPPFSSSGSLQQTSSSSTSNHFSYTSTPKENSSLSLAAALPPPPLLQSTGGELQYPPIFEPGSYSLSEKNVEMHITYSRSSATTLPPVPAPRTKFLIPQSPSVDSALGSTSASAICHQHRVVQVQLETKNPAFGHTNESSNA